jgi:hypothetical protein
MTGLLRPRHGPCPLSLCDPALAELLISLAGAGHHSTAPVSIDGATGRRAAVVEETGHVARVTQSAAAVPSRRSVVFPDKWGELHIGRVLQLATFLDSDLRQPLSPFRVLQVVPSIPEGRLQLGVVESPG